MKSKVAYVFVQDLFAGRLTDTDEGYEFEYDEEYLNMPDAKAVSLTMPLRTEKFKSRTLFAFFDGLIPEGWLLDIVTDNWKLNPKDRFGLLLVACNDCIGDVSIRGEV